MFDTNDVRDGICCRYAQVSKHATDKLFPLELICAVMFQTKWVWFIVKSRHCHFESRNCPTIVSSLVVKDSTNVIFSFLQAYIQCMTWSHASLHRESNKFNEATIVPSTCRSVYKFWIQQSYIHVQRYNFNTQHKQIWLWSESLCPDRFTTALE